MQLRTHDPPPCGDTGSIGIPESTEGEEQVDSSRKPPNTTHPITHHPLRELRRTRFLAFTRRAREGRTKHKRFSKEVVRGYGLNCPKNVVKLAGHYDSYKPARDGSYQIGSTDHFSHTPSLELRRSEYRDLRRTARTAQMDKWEKDFRMKQSNQNNKKKQ